MKSSLRSDEIFGVPPQMKLNPPHLPPREAGFRPQMADLAEKLSPEFRALREYSHAQPLVSKLPDGFGGECGPDSATLRFLI